MLIKCSPSFSSSALEFDVCAVRRGMVGGRGAWKGARKQVYLTAAAVEEAQLPLGHQSRCPQTSPSQGRKILSP